MENSDNFSREKDHIGGKDSGKVNRIYVIFCKNTLLSLPNLVSFLENLGSAMADNQAVFSIHLPQIFYMLVTSNSLYEVCIHYLSFIIYLYSIANISPLLLLYWNINKKSVMSYFIFSSYASLINLILREQMFNIIAVNMCKYKYY